MSEGHPMKIKVLGISASPRKNGNSSYLLKEALESAAAVAPEIVETELYSLAGKQYRGCTMCLKCLESAGECVSNSKDGLPELRDKWLEADVIIYSIPVYHMGMPGNLKNFLDRMGNAMACKYFPVFPRQMKCIGTITQGDCWFSGQENTIMQIINSSMVLGCIPVSGDQPECYIGAGGSTDRGLESDYYEKAVKEERPLALWTLRASRSLGKRAVETCILVKAGAEASRERFGDDPMFAPLMERAGS
jgi:multimeric flavodoxin WrbA